MIHGQSPIVEYQVDPRRNGTSIVITLRSLTSVRWNTSPSGDTNAENPVGDTCTTQRPVSTARNLLEATCWVCRIVPV